MKIKNVKRLDKMQYFQRAMSVSKEYRQYVDDPNFAIFINTLLNELLSQCDSSVLFKLIPNLQRLGCKKANEEAYENEDSNDRI